MEPKALQKVKGDCPARVREEQTAWAGPAWAQLVAGHAREGARQVVRSEPRAAPLLPRVGPGQEAGGARPATRGCGRGRSRLGSRRRGCRSPQGWQTSRRGLRQRGCRPLGDTAGIVIGRLERPGRQRHRPLRAWGNIRCGDGRSWGRERQRRQRWPCFGGRILGSSVHLMGCKGLNRFFELCEI